MIYNPQHSFAKFKDLSDFKELSLDSMHKKLYDFLKKFTNFKDVNLEEERKKKEMFQIKKTQKNLTTQR